MRASHPISVTTDGWNGLKKIMPGILKPLPETGTGSPQDMTQALCGTSYLNRIVDYA
jgi:hypothetical protein